MSDPVKNENSSTITSFKVSDRSLVTVGFGLVSSYFHDPIDLIQWTLVVTKSIGLSYKFVITKVSLQTRSFWSKEKN